MRRRIITYLLLTVALRQAAYAQDIRLLSQGANSTVIEVVPDSTGVDTTNADGVKYLDLFYRHSFPEMNSSGHYMKKYLPVLTGVFSKQIQVQVMQTDYKSVSMMQPVRSSFVPSVASSVPASEFVSYDPPFIMRKHFVARLRVYPFLYDSLAGTYRILKRVVFQVSSVGEGVVNREVAADHLLSEALINYSQVRNEVVSGSVSSGFLQGQLQKTQTSSLLAQGPWYSLPISQSGIYKLTYQNLKDAKVLADSIHLSTIRIFNNGGTELPENPNAARPGELIENGIYVYDARGDNLFDDSRDYVLFYGKSPREWTYDSVAKTYRHYLNHYTETNYYFMTYGGQAGKRMQNVQSYQSSSYYTPQNFTCGIAADSEISNLQGSGKYWYGAELQPPSSGNLNSNTIIYLNKLNGLDSTQKIIYRAAFVSRSTLGNYFSMYENSTGAALGSVFGGTISDYNDDQGAYAVAVNTQDYSGTGNIPDEMSALKIVYSSSSTAAQGYVDWFEILYKRKFQAVNDVLDFYSPDTTAPVQFSVQGFSNNDVKVFNVSVFSNVTMIQPQSTDNGTAVFGIQTSAGSSQQFFAVGENGFLPVAGISVVQNSNLRGQVSGADIIIVSPPDFVSQASQLGNFKKSFDGNDALVVKTTDIYDEFGCGIPDPTAIRDYLNFALTNFQETPTYVILFGAGSYDYKNKAGTMPEYVPAYESSESLDQINSYSTDDYFVEFGGSLTSYPVSLSLGRLPARSQQDATAIVNKIEQYESNPSYGSWRNLVTFVADDHNSNKIDDYLSTFTQDSEKLAENANTPPDLDRRKIYLGAYPTIVSTQGIRNPAASADVVNQINQGTAVINFVGHGAPSVWSYTHVFENDVTIPQLTNITKLTLCVAATCDFGRDDDPVNQSGAELLLLSNQGGAIGVMSSTRETYESDNEELNSDFFQGLFSRDSLHNAARIGDAFFLMKVLPSISTNSNDIKYNYIGDPTVRLALPTYLDSVLSVNGKTLSGTTPIQIRALDSVDIKGAVYHPNKTLWNDFNGTALLTIFDSDKDILIPNLGYSYVSQGSELFRGEISVKQGLFDAKAIIPKDISYSNNAGKIEMYFQANGSDGFGYTRNIIVGGTNSNVSNDGRGPIINVYLDTTNFKEGDIVSDRPTLIVDLHAENGINLSDAAVGHNLQAVFDGQQSVDLIPYYTGNVDSYTDGTVNYPITLSLAPGRHSVTVTAFDVFNNAAEATTTFDLESSDQLSISDVYNYPDPFRNGTAFTFRRTAFGGAGQPVNVKIKVYTLSGRLIKTIAAPGLLDTFVKIEWDGLDDDGNRLANGVYLYKVIVTSAVDGSQTVEAIGKMAVLR